MDDWELKLNKLYRWCWGNTDSDTLSSQDCSSCPALGTWRSQHRIEVLGKGAGALSYFERLKWRFCLYTTWFSWSSVCLPCFEAVSRIIKSCCWREEGVCVNSFSSPMHKVWRKLFPDILPLADRFRAAFREFVSGRRMPQSFLFTQVVL